MKYLLLLVLCCAIVSCQARATNDQFVNKRFIGSIGGWINNNIINPINNNIINPITGGITSVINTIADPLQSFGNTLQNLFGQVDTFFSQTLGNAVNNAINSIKDTAGQVINIVQALFNGGTYTGQQDPCAMTCFQRINYNGEVKEYYFDQPNGCISKGYIDPSVKMFDSCCDKHNQCLNSKCCTTDCQALKNDCDTEYDSCLKSTCIPFISDNTQFYTCLARGALIASVAVNQSCTASITVNRKLCFC